MEETAIPTKLHTAPTATATMKVRRIFLQTSNAVAAGRTRRPNTASAPAARMAIEMVTPSVRKSTIFQSRGRTPNACAMSGSNDTNTNSL